MVRLIPVQWSIKQLGTTADTLIQSLRTEISLPKRSSGVENRVESVSSPVVEHADTDEQDDQIQIR